MSLLPYKIPEFYYSCIKTELWTYLFCGFNLNKKMPEAQTSPTPQEKQTCFNIWLALHLRQDI